MMWERIKSAREATRLTQTDVAVRMGVTPQSVQQWETPPEKDGTCPKPKRIDTLASVLNVSNIWLATGEGEIRRKPVLKAPSPKEKTLLEKWAKLPDSAKEHFEALIDDMIASPTTLEVDRERYGEHIKAIHDNYQKQGEKLSETDDMLLDEIVIKTYAAIKKLKKKMTDKETMIFVTDAFETLRYRENPDTNNIIDLLDFHLSHKRNAVNGLREDNREETREIQTTQKNIT